MEGDYAWQYVQTLNTQKCIEQAASNAVAAVSTIRQNPMAYKCPHML
jgi:hypothetical protein